MERAGEVYPECDPEEGAALRINVTYFLVPSGL